MSGAGSSRSRAWAPKRRLLTQVAHHLIAPEQAREAAFEHDTATAMDAFLRTDPKAITFHLAGMPQHMSFDDFGIVCGFYDAAGRHED
ncbi:hypothetical protein LINGRAHAP2_LOCUS24072 [Linum grandiflorum]